MNTSVCTTPACLQAASVFLSSLSPKYKTLDPCTNFEEMVCDGWRDQHIIRPEAGLNDSFSAMSDRSQVILRSILEAQYPGPHVTISLDQDNFEKAQGAYNACMAVDDIKKRGLSPMEKMLDELAATFGNASDWSDAQLYLSHNGVRSMIGLGVGADDKSPVGAPSSRCPTHLELLLTIYRIRKSSASSRGPPRDCRPPITTGTAKWLPTIRMPSAKCSVPSS